MASVSRFDGSVSCARGRAVLLIFWTLVVFILSLMPLDTGPIGVSGLDKLAHLVVYAVTSLLCCRLLFSLGVMNGNTVYLSVIYAAVIGMLLELLQALLTHGRQFEFLDIIANLFGAALGCGVFCLTLRTGSGYGSNSE